MGQARAQHAATVTARGAEVLALVALRLTNAEIADELVISERTVESHVSSLLRKLELPNRRALARHAAGTSVEAARSGAPGLPVPATDFVGRVVERATLAAALVTATGPGGVGKTRLALSVAADLASERRDGVWFVDLIRVPDPGMVSTVVASAVGVPEHLTATVEQALVASLAPRDGLLVLDNCEHVLDGVRACVNIIVAGCPRITVLATSRIRLLVPYERVFAVAGLSVEPDGGDAMELFTARAGGVTGGPPALDAARVAALCRALDGNALAVELAAARLPALGLDGLESGLDDRLRFLTSGTRSEDRHRSLRAAIDWSFDLLLTEDRNLLTTVAVFASLFDVDAAWSLAGSGGGRPGIAEGLARLAEHSLLVVEHGETTRYRALEMIRQFGAEQLASAGTLEQVRAGHDLYCRRALDALACTPAAEIDGAWCDRFDRIAEDVQAALAWSARDHGRRAATVDLADHFASLLFLQGRPAQAQRLFEVAAAAALTVPDRTPHLQSAAGAAASRWAGEEALRLYRAAADAALAAGDRESAARSLATMAMYLRRATGIMGVVHPGGEADRLVAEAAVLSVGSMANDAALAVAAWGDVPSRRDADRASALAERSGDILLGSIALDMATAASLCDNDLAGAVRIARHRLELLGQLEIGPQAGFELTDACLMAAEAHLATGDLAGAGAHADALAGLPFLRDERHLATSRRVLVDALAGRHDAVVRTGERFRAAWEQAGRPVAPNLARAAYAVAMVLGMRREDADRAAWMRTTVDLGVDPKTLAGPGLGWAPVFDGLLALHRGDGAAALERLAADVGEAGRLRPWSFGAWRPWYAALRVEAAVMFGGADGASVVERARPIVRDNPIALAIVDRAEALAERDAASVRRFTSVFATLGCPYQAARTVALAGLASGSRAGDAGTDGR